MLVFRFGWPSQSRSITILQKSKQGMALTALAGPVMNLILAFLFLGIFVGLFHVTEGSTEGILGYLMLLAQYTAIMNIGLGVFNLIPIPPLDGSKVLGIFLPQRTYFQLMRYERYGGLLMIVLLYTGVLSRRWNPPRWTPGVDAACLDVKMAVKKRKFVFTAVFVQTIGSKIVRSMLAERTYKIIARYLLHRYIRRLCRQSPFCLPSAAWA